MARSRTQKDGLNTEDAEKLCVEAGMIMRVTVKDGEPLMVTQEIRSNRLNVSVDGNIVKSTGKIG